MSTIPETAGQAAPVLGDDLTSLIDGIRGFCTELDTLADAVEALALKPMTLHERQTITTMIAGSSDPAGQQIDVQALVTALVRHLLTPDALPAEAQPYARKARAAMTEHDSLAPRDAVGRAVYELNPI